MDIEKLLYALPGILLALTVHEFAHGITAYWCKDNTARDMGRLTFNPIAHLDPLGTIMLIGSLLYQQIPFGWAKPVPINPANFKHLKRDLILVSFAGPFSNILLAIISGILYKTLIAFGIASNSIVFPFLNLLIAINLGLATFNLIPIPPLDGSKILMCLLPDKYLPTFDRYSQHVTIAFIIMLIVESTLRIRTISYILDPIFIIPTMVWRVLIA